MQLEEFASISKTAHVMYDCNNKNFRYVDYLWNFNWWLMIVMFNFSDKKYFLSVFRKQFSNSGVKFIQKENIDTLKHVL